MFTTPDDISRCRKIVERYLKDKNKNLDNATKDKIVQEVLELTYATGGDYTKESLDQYLQMYIKNNPI